ncbi:MAG: pseudouridine-5'-phosphate glycosidase [Gemmataceae bacterium]|nr:pseudouridine-5'-phosphate glycosidase [Gemmataceae bacterium]
MDELLSIAPLVAAALRERRPVVALESTIISHGLPAPQNFETAIAAEVVIRSEGAMPATILLRDGRAIVGASEAEVRELATLEDVTKTSRRDVGYVLATKRWGGTTVSATMQIAHAAGIRVFATGGIGGAHRGDPWDISADLTELARTPVAVVCAGAKSILDLPRTLEILETHGVPVIGVGINTFPAFYVRSSGLPVSARIDDPADIAATLRAHWAVGGAGAVIALPLPESSALPADEIEQAIAAAEQEATRARVRGKELTPFLLAKLAASTSGRSLIANRELLLANARLAAQIAAFLA